MEKLLRIFEELPNGDVLQSLRVESPPFYKFARRICAEDVTMVKPIINELLMPFNYHRSFTAHETGAANPADSHEYFSHMHMYSLIWFFFRKNLFLVDSFPWKSHTYISKLLS